jgi:hypothetical protein
MTEIKKNVNIQNRADVVFGKFVHEFNSWWPREYTWSQEKLVEIKIEPHEDGMCTEIGPFGFRCDWGRLTELKPGKMIRMKWQISPKREPVPDPDKASEIKIEFLNKGGGTSLLFEHYDLQNHGEGANEYREMMNSEYGWDYILGMFKEYCER